MECPKVYMKLPQTKLQSQKLYQQLLVLLIIGIFYFAYAKNLSTPAGQIFEATLLEKPSESFQTLKFILPAFCFSPSLACRLHQDPEGPKYGAEGRPCRVLGLHLRGVSLSASDFQREMCIYQFLLPTSFFLFMIFFEQLLYCQLKRY